MPDIALSKAPASPDVEPACDAAGTDYIIDLLTIRVSSGVLWDRMRESISARLKSILTRLAPTAVYRFTGPDMTRCIVTFPAPDERAAKACVVTAHELIIGLMGRCEYSDIHVSRTLIDATRGPYPARFTSDELARLLEAAKTHAIAPSRQPARKSVPAEAPKAKDALSPATRHRNLTAEYGFEPVWDAQAQAVCMYVCSAVRIYEGGEPGAPVAHSDLTPKECASIEFEGAFTGIEQLVKRVESGDRFMLNLSLGFETLSSPSCRMELTQICRGILPVYRPYLLFTLTGVPTGVSAARLSDFVMLLRPFGRVIAVIASGERNHFTYQNLGLSGLAADLSRDSEIRRRGDILTLAAASRNFKLGAMLYNVDDAEIVAFAHAADVRLFHGSVIGKALPEPKRMTHLPLAALLPAAENAGEEEWF